MGKGKIMLAIFVAVIGALIFINYLGDYTASVNVFDVEFNTKLLKPGATVVNIPPFGKIIAKTHHTPVQLDITVMNIKPGVVKNLFDNPITQNEFISGIKIEAHKVVKAYVLKLLLLSFTGSALFTLIFRYDVKTILLCGLLGLFVPLSLGGYVYNSYKYDAFMDPRYEGILEAAPWMMSLAQQTLVKIDKLGEQMQVITRNANHLFSKINDIQPIDTENASLKILHVSDIHNNPAAFDLIEQTVKSFNVDFIIDTGDITDYGTPLEAQFIKRINNLGIPYVFVPGNHESPEVINAMKAQRNVIVLDKAHINIKGITVYGIGDPGSHSKLAEVTTDEIIREYSLSIKQELESNVIKPDIIAVHNPKMAQYFEVTAPTILTGHTHFFGIEKKDDSVIINAGTTGAAGIRGLQSSHDVPYSEVLLYFSSDIEQNSKLTAADIIKVYSLSKKGLILERFLNQ
jgi:predicted phosphodiesterase